MEKETGVETAGEHKLGVLRARKIPGGGATAAQAARRSQKTATFRQATRQLRRCSLPVLGWCEVFHWLIGSGPEWSWASTNSSLEHRGDKKSKKK